MTPLDFIASLDHGEAKSAALTVYNLMTQSMSKFIDAPDVLKRELSTYQWCTTNGNRWVLAVGDKTATIFLDTDEKTYHASVNIEWCAGNTIHESSTDCLKKAKAACIREIEEQTAYEKLMFSPEFEQLLVSRQLEDLEETDG